MWGNILRVGRVLEKISVPFAGSFGKVIENGLGSWFWLDKWVGNYRLCDKSLNSFILKAKKRVRLVKGGNGMVGFGLRRGIGKGS